MQPNQPNNNRIKPTRIRRMSKIVTHLFMAKPNKINRPTSSSNSQFASDAVVKSKLEEVLYYGYRQNLIAKRRYICIAYALLVLLGTILCYTLAHTELLHYDLNTDPTHFLSLNSNKNLDQLNQTKVLFHKIIITLKCALTCSTIFLMILAFYYHHTEGQIYKFDNNLSIEKSFFTVYKSNYVLLIVELSILAIHPFYLPSNYLNFYNYDWVYFLMIFRIPYALRVVIVSNELFYSTKVQTVANLNRFSIGMISYENFGLIIRSSIEAKAFRIMTFTVLVTWIWFAYLILLHEWRHRLVSPADFCEVSNSCVIDIKDAIWLVWISFTTIGYGDFYPHSIIGRSIIVCESILSMVTTSVLIGVMTFKLTMNHREKMVYYKLRESRMESEMKDKAAIVLQRIWRAKVRSRRNDKNGKVAPIESSETFVRTVLTTSLDQSLESNDEQVIRIQDYQPQNFRETPSNLRKTNSVDSAGGYSNKLVKINANFPENPGSQQHKIRQPTSSNGRYAISSLNTSHLSQTSEFQRQLESAMNKGSIGNCKIIHSTKVVRAIHDFAMIRNKVMFKSEGREDLEDTKRRIYKVGSQVENVKNTTDELRDRIDKLSSRVVSIENGMFQILEILKKRE